MTIERDSGLQRWEQGERFRSMVIGLLAGSVLLLALAIGTLIFQVRDQRTGLESQAEIIARVEEAQQSSICVGRRIGEGVGVFTALVLADPEPGEVDPALLQRLQRANDGLRNIEEACG